MKYYPVYIDISKRKCVVAGGGDVAERKVERLLECGARVVVIGNELTPNLEAMKNEEKISHIPDNYKNDYIEGALLVIGATDRDEINERIYRDSQERGILVNIVDDPAKCDFIVPSVFQQGDLSIAISTGGKSPALARNLREELEQRYGHEYRILLNIMGDIREKIISRGEPSDENKKLFESVLNSDILQHIREKNWDKVRKIIHDLVGEDINIDEFGKGFNSKR